MTSLLTEKTNLSPINCTLRYCTYIMLLNEQQQLWIYRHQSSQSGVAIKLDNLNSRLLLLIHPRHKETQGDGDVVSAALMQSGGLAASPPGERAMWLINRKCRIEISEITGCSLRSGEEHLPLGYGVDQHTHIYIHTYTHSRRMDTRTSRVSPSRRRLRLQSQSYTGIRARA